jgi:hypothetical protein
MSIRQYLQRELLESDTVVIACRALERLSLCTDRVMNLGGPLWTSISNAPD